MANEIAIPLLPCRSIDEMADFYTMLGFRRSYYQVRPNPYVLLKREDLQLGFFGMPEAFKPEDSYGTCVIIVPDTGELFEAFAAGMRAAHGKLLVSGIPRMTRPRRRKNDGNHSGFAVIDPGGNWIRFMAARPLPEKEEATSRLATSLDRAVVMGDSNGDHERAAEILDGALERDKDTASAAELLEALVYRAELAVRAKDHAAAGHALARARAIALTEAEREQLAQPLAAIDDLEAVLGL